MRGPAPKPSALRQRKNKVVTAALLSVAPQMESVPTLPQRGRRKWHDLTVAWWADIWQSPMAPEFLQSDIHGLYILADLIDTYWKKPSTKLAAEINRHRQCFGLTPIDRRRLQWEVQKVEDAERKRPQRRAPEPADDPRRFLTVVL